VFIFRSSHVKFSLHPIFAGGAEEVGSIHDASGVVHGWDRTSKDVHVMIFREAFHHLDEAWELPGEIADLFTYWTTHVPESQELDGKILRKYDELAFIISRR